MSFELRLEEMTVAEKLQVMEMVWDSLRGKPSELKSPTWHEEVLLDRQCRLESGEATVSPWSEAKRRLQDLG